jgi:DNA-binding NarL/FixJ family response regulator
MAVETSKDLRVDGSFSWADPVVTQARKHHPAVVVVDLTGRDVPSTAGFVRSLRAVDPPVGILCVGDHENPALLAALHSGASGLIEPNQSVEEYVEAVRAVAADEAVLSSSLARKLLERLRAMPVSDSEPTFEPVLSRREIAIVQGVSEGLTNTQLAMQLGISPSTVKNHLYNVSRKLGVSSRSQAVAEAIKRGLIEV